MALLEVQRLHKSFRLTGGRGRSDVLHAIDDVSFVVEQGETIGLVGESGCGKSTLARCLLRIHEPSAGRIVFDGLDITSISARKLRPVRREMSLVFQDPRSSLNPRRRIVDIVGAPLRIHGMAGRRAIRQRVTETLELVGLGEEYLQRFPHEFSGGQRQRIGLARALITRPRLLICDEPVSALDVSIQAQILNLLLDIRDELGITCIFIAHDLGVVRQVSTRVAVMYLGRLVEIAETERVFAEPAHPYTESLLRAIPVPDPTVGLSEETLEGEVPSPVNLPQGCRFKSRCWRSSERCTLVDPPLAPVAVAEHLVACHHPAGAVAELVGGTAQK